MAFLLHELLTESARKTPGNIALRFREQTMTYAQLEQQADKLARDLRRLGIKEKDRIGIYMQRSIQSVVAVMGVLKAGATYVPVDPMSPPGRLRYIINKCAITFLLTFKEKLGSIEKAFAEHSPLATILVLDGLPASGRSKAGKEVIDWQTLPDMPEHKNISLNINDSDLAYILFTSGSTGNPKGVMISHRNSLTFIDSIYSFLQFRQEDRFSNNSPLHFDLSVFDYFVAFKAGACVVIVPEITTMFPAKLAECIEKNRITIWNSVPSLLSLLANLKNLEQCDFSSLRQVLFAGEIFPVKYLRRMKQVMPQADFYNIYGQTEANSSTYYRVEQVPGDDTVVLPIGKPFPDFDVFAIDETGKKVERPGDKGELYVNGTSVAAGYWQDDEKTEKAFVRNPLAPESGRKVYKTGDLVTVDKEGNYVFLGRKDHMIKSRGYRIEIGEIENVIAGHEQVKQAVVVPIPDELIGNRIAVVIVPSEGNELHKNDIVSHCAKRLPKYMIPEIIAFRDSIPTTSSGKADRKQLAERMNAGEFQNIRA